VIVVGDRDIEAGTVGLRFRGDESERRGIPLDAAVAEVVESCAAPR
jgi:threonyl-tRNA synthetase